MKSHRTSPLAAPVVLLAAMAPLLMGGCPDVRDPFVNAFETAVRGIIDQAITDWFDQYRSD